MLFNIVLSASFAALASDTLDLPYSEIANRNIFGLKARLEKPDSAPAVSLPPKVRLAGITTILGRKTAFLMITGSESGRLRECLVLAEGKAENGVTLREIDEKAAVVTIVNHGQEQILEFRQVAN